MTETAELELIHSPADILRGVGLEPTLQRGGGRYINAETGLPGVFFWATCKPRFGEDEIGIQFRGVHGPRAEDDLAARLIGIGLVRRNNNPSDRTYSLVVPRLRGTVPDMDALAVIKQRISAVLAHGFRPPAASAAPVRDAVDFMSFIARTLPAAVELELPQRDSGEVRPELF